MFMSQHKLHQFQDNFVSNVRASLFLKTQASRKCNDVYAVLDYQLKEKNVLYVKVY